jgi:hypothetical protein
MTSEVENGIYIGNYAGYSLRKANYVVFIGDGAGRDLVEAHNLLIIKTKNAVIKKRITRNEWKQIKKILVGAMLNYKEKAGK